MNKEKYKEISKRNLNVNNSFEIEKLFDVMFMVEVSGKHIERAILVAVSLPFEEQNSKFLYREMIEEHLNELEELALTAGAETIIKIIQNRLAIDPAYYLGKGKAEEIANLAETNAIDIVIFDDDLSPIQIRNLEKVINKKIIDRSGLILDIFASRAKTKEAKTQVELAQLQYMLPRLTKAWTHLSKQFGGIGTKGPGETQIETDRRLIRKRISLLKEKLEKIESQRSTQSSSRKEVVKISLVGYTNAGKSTLFNLLTKSNVFAEDKLFATLDSTTRALELNKKQKILLSDTVGFIRKLPANLIASFKSTLNEVRDADLIIHVIDVSHPFFEDHIKVVDETLKELRCENKNQLKVFNKIDALADRHKIHSLKSKYKNSVIISALRGINILELKEKILKFTEINFVKDSIRLHIDESKKAAKIHALAEIISTRYDENSVYITYKTNKENSDKIKKMVYEE